MGKEANIIRIVEGTITTNVDEGIAINYKWVDNTEHRYVTDQDMYAYIIKGKPVYLHNVGSLYGDMVSSEVGSELYSMIYNSEVGVQLIRFMEALREEGKFPLKKAIIIGGIAIIIIILWQTGFLSNLIGDIIPTDTVPVEGVK